MIKLTKDICRLTDVESILSAVMNKQHVYVISDGYTDDFLYMKDLYNMPFNDVCSFMKFVNDAEKNIIFVTNIFGIKNRD